VEFRVEYASSSSGKCIGCERPIRMPSKVVKIFKKVRPIISEDGRADCYYHVECFVDVHKEQFKSMAVEISQVLMSK
jgi:hypothetical protein